MEKRYNEEERAEVLRAYNNRQVSKKKFCQERGIASSTISSWQQRQKRQRRDKNADYEAEFVELRMEEGAGEHRAREKEIGEYAQASGEEKIELQIGGLQIRLPQKIESDMLERVLRAVMKGC